MPYSHANGALSVVMAGCYLAGAYLSWALKTDLMFSTQSALPLKLRIYIYIYVTGGFTYGIFPCLCLQLTLPEGNQQNCNWFNLLFTTYSLHDSKAVCERRRRRNTWSIRVHAAKIKLSKVCIIAQEGVTVVISYYICLALI